MTLSRNFDAKLLLCVNFIDLMWVVFRTILMTAVMKVVKFRLNVEEVGES
jgi:hypothetical protein